MTAQHLWHPFSDMASVGGREITLVSGDGAWVTDADGRRYLDASASLWYCNVGHGRRELADAAAAQMRELAAYQTFEFYATPPVAALARRVADLCPIPDARVFFTPGGGWCVVQQGMNDANGMARRYHWLASRLRSFVNEPHAAVCGEREAATLNLVAEESEAARTAFAGTAIEINQNTRWANQAEASLP